MDINSLIISNSHSNLCKGMFKVLNCNAFWVMHSNPHSLHMLATDKSILEHYWDKKYYLDDPSINAPIDPADDDTAWKVSLGTHSDNFNNNGFLSDLNKVFNIEEFVSIEKRVGNENYCFRFFTPNDRYIFMNKIINDMPIIKIFINSMTEKFKSELDKQPDINITALKGH